MPNNSPNQDLRLDQTKQTELLISGAVDMLKNIPEDGSRESLQLATEVIQGLNQNFSDIASLATIAQLMPGRFIGPDAWIFQDRNIGKIPPLPSDLLEILKSECDLSKDGRVVAETHRLTLVPGSISEQPFTINSFHDLASELGKSGIFHRKALYNYQPFANSALAGGRWVLQYDGVAPETLGKTSIEQSVKVNNLAHYRTAGILEHMATILLHYFETGEKLYTNLYARCEEKWTTGAGVGAGFFTAEGLEVSYDSVDSLNGPVGLAVVRKF